MLTRNKQQKNYENLFIWALQNRASEYWFILVGGVSLFA